MSSVISLHLAQNWSMYHEFVVSRLVGASNYRMLWKVNLVKVPTPDHSKCLYMAEKGTKAVIPVMTCSTLNFFQMGKGCKNFWGGEEEMWRNGFKCGGLMFIETICNCEKWNLTINLMCSVNQVFLDGSNGGEGGVI